MDNPQIKRLQSLLSYEILDSPQDDYFDDLVKLVSIICNTPIALISFIDDQRQWYKAKIGIDMSEVPIEESICQYTLLQDDILEISDTLLDERLENNPHVHKIGGMRFYVGISLKSLDGYAIGTVCAVDVKPKTLTNIQKEGLRIIMRQVMQHLNTKNKNNRLSAELELVLQQKIKSAQEQIETQETAYNNLLEALSKSNAVVEFTPDGDILHANEAFQKISGYSANELIGKPHSILLSNAEKIAVTDFWENLHAEKFLSGRFKRIHKNGNNFWVQASYNSVFDANGKLLKITKIAQDITSEIIAKETLEEAKILADSLNQHKDLFIANMSHEIRTPINAIIGFTDLLLEKEKEDHKLKQLNAIKTAGDSLLYLVNDILDISKIEAGIFQIDRSIFNLESTIENIFSILKVKALDKNIDFNYSLEKQIPAHFWGDKNRLTQVLLNLLGNALKFTPEGSVDLNIQILNVVDDIITLQFIISDTGIGIPEDKLAIIFERFTQAEDNTTRKFGGTGLGLNICKQLIDKQGGKIEVNSQVNKGSEFRVELPYEIAPDQLASGESHSLKSLSNSSGRILICEDNEMNQLLMKTIFEDSPFHIDIANNGFEGLALLQSTPYHLVLMDIQMPEMDGYQTTIAIRNELKLTLPIIALTAHSFVKEKNKCLALGMNDYLSKPFKKEELFERIHYWFNQVDTTKNRSQLLSLEKLEELSGGDKKFQLEMLTLFIKQSTEGLKLIQKAIGTGDLEIIKQQAHKLKSSFGIINADTTFLIALEQNPSDKETDKIVESFKKQIISLHTEIEQIILNLQS